MKLLRNLFSFSLGLSPSFISPSKIISEEKWMGQNLAWDIFISQAWRWFISLFLTLHWLELDATRLGNMLLSLSIAGK